MPCSRRSTSRKKVPTEEEKVETKLDDEAKKILDTMKKLGKPVKCGEIAKEMGVPVQKVTGKLRSLVRSGLVKKEGDLYKLA